MDKPLASQLLMDVRAITFNLTAPFKRDCGVCSPVKWDAGVILSAAHTRGRISSGLAEMIRQNYPQTETLCYATGDDSAFAVLTAERLGLGLPLFSPSKVPSGVNTVVVCDCLSSSALSAVKIIEENGGVVLGVACIFDHGMKNDRARFEEADVEYCALADLDTAVQIGLKKELLKPTDTVAVLAYRDNPIDDRWMEMIV